MRGIATANLCRHHIKKRTIFGCYIYYPTAESLGVHIASRTVRVGDFPNSVVYFYTFNPFTDTAKNESPKPQTYFELSFLVSAPPVALLLPVVVAGLFPAPPEVTCFILSIQHHSNYTMLLKIYHLEPGATRFCVTSEIR